MAYKILEVLGDVTADEEAAALEPTVSASPNQLCYLVVANPDEEDTVYISRAGEEDEAFPVPPEQSWVFGPILFRDVTTFGLYADDETGHSCAVTLLTGGTTVNARKTGIEIPKLPFEFYQLNYRKDPTVNVTVEAPEEDPG
jgi:hypothetical protein